MQQSSIGRCAALLCRAAVPRCCAALLWHERCKHVLCGPLEHVSSKIRSDISSKVRSDLSKVDAKSGEKVGFDGKVYDSACF
jgi:hypothetical protein